MANQHGLAEARSTYPLGLADWTKSPCVKLYLVIDATPVSSLLGHQPPAPNHRLPLGRHLSPTAGKTSCSWCYVSAAPATFGGPLVVPKPLSLVAL